MFVEGPGINSFLAAALGSELPRDLHAPHRTPLPAASPAAPRQCLRGAGSLPAALPVHVRRPPRSHGAAGTGPLDFLTPSSLPSWVGLWAGREGRGFRLPASGRAVSGARESEPRGPCSGSPGAGPWRWICPGAERSGPGRWLASPGSPPHPQERSAAGGAPRGPESCRPRGGGERGPGRVGEGAGNWGAGPGAPQGAHLPLWGGRNGGCTLGWDVEAHGSFWFPPRVLSRDFCLPTGPWPLRYPSLFLCKVPLLISETCTC